MYMSSFGCRCAIEYFLGLRSSIWRLDYHPRMANWKTNFTFINLRASGDNVQKMGTLVGSADPTIVGLAPPLCSQFHQEVTYRRWTFGSTKEGSTDPTMGPSSHLVCTNWHGIPSRRQHQSHLSLGRSTDLHVSPILSRFTPIDVTMMNMWWKSTTVDHMAVPRSVYPTVHARGHADRWRGAGVAPTPSPPYKYPLREPS